MDSPAPNEQDIERDITRLLRKKHRKEKLTLQETQWLRDRGVLPPAKPARRRK